MRWVLHNTLSQSHYWKLEHNSSPAELRYNKESRSLRLTAGTRRLFFLERTGFLQNRFLLRTEYSVIVGEAYSTRHLLSGVLSLENTRLVYKVEGDLLRIHTKSGEQLAQTTIPDLRSLDSFEFFALVFALSKVQLSDKLRATVPANGF